MAAVRQYLDLMEWNGSTGEDGVDSDGNPIPGTPVPVSNAFCRYENFNAGNRKEFTNRDGEAVLATGVIYVRFGTQVPERFSWVSVTRNAVQVFEGEILNVYRGQLNSTLHVLENVRD